MTQPDPRRQAPIEHRVAPEAAARFATAPRAAGPAPTAAASLRRRIDGRRAQARAGGVRRHVIGTAVPAALAVTGLVVFAAGGPPVSSVLVVLLLVAVGVAGGVWWARALLGFDAPTRELRRRASAETRTARALDPLESAGWVLLHDRLVANERVPHVLVGPPGAVVLHPHSFGRLAPLRAVARRVLRLGRRPVPGLVEPAELGDPVALRTRDNLLGVLTHEPDLAGWYVVVHAVTPVLDLPADRALFSATPVVHRVVGPALRRTLESELPGGLNRTAVAYLASIVDHACPPA